MVDSALPPETPQNAAAQEPSGPEGPTPSALSEAADLAPPAASANEAVAPVNEATAAPTDASAMAPANPEPAPLSEPATPEPVGSGAAAAAPAPTTTPTATTPVAAATASLGPSPAAAPQPDPTPSVPPEPAAPAMAVSPAGIASTITVPPLEDAPKGEGEGGEFELLINRVSQWLKEQDLPARWEGLQGPLRGLALLLLALVLLRLYGALIDTLDSLPLVPRLFQLVGVIVLVKFSLTNLVRTSDRERLISAWQQRWASFRGRV